jgi:hypothetical protein
MPARVSVTFFLIITLLLFGIPSALALADETNLEDSIKELEIIAKRTEAGSIPSLNDMARLQHLLLESEKALTIQQNISALRLVIDIAALVSLALRRDPQILLCAVDLDHYLKTLVEVIGKVDKVGYLQYKRNRTIGLCDGPKDYIYSYEDRVLKWELKYQYDEIIELLRASENEYYGIDVSYKHITDSTRYRNDLEWSFKIRNYGKDSDICSFILLFPNFPKKTLLEDSILNQRYESLIRRRGAKRRLLPEGWTIKYGEGFIEFKGENPEDLLTYNKELTFTLITDDNHTDVGIITVLSNADLDSVLCHSITDDNGYASSITGIVGPMFMSEEGTYDSDYSSEEVKYLKGCARVLAKTSAERNSKFARKVTVIPKDNQLNFLIFDLSLYAINSHYFAGDTCNAMAIEVLTFLEHYASNQARDEIVQAYIDSYSQSFECEGAEAANP